MIFEIKLSLVKVADFSAEVKEEILERLERNFKSALKMIHKLALDSIFTSRRRRKGVKRAERNFMNDLWNDITGQCCKFTRIVKWPDERTANKAMREI